MPSSRLLLLSPAIALLCVMAACKDAEILRPTKPSCSTKNNYTDGSTYEQNLKQLLDALPSAAGDSGWFYKGSAGADADHVFGLIMCFADRNATQCRYCLAGAPAGITTVCPGSRNVSALYDACVLRYSSAPLQTTADLNYVYAVYVGTPGASGTVPSATATWGRLMSRLTGDAAASPLRLANYSTPFSSSQTMNGLAQCTRDLNASECSSCISNYTDRLGNMFPNNTGGAIKGYSCYLIYQVGRLNLTLPPAVARPPGAQRATGVLLINLLVGIVFICSSILLCIAGYFIWRRRRRATVLDGSWKQELDDELEMVDVMNMTVPKKYSYTELATATDNFSDQHRLGAGGGGSVYRGFLQNLEVAVKRLYRDDSSGSDKRRKKEFISEVKTISQIRHRNVVRLIGWCHGNGEYLLVYELMPNGDLHERLHKDRQDALPWSTRRGIVEGLASAVQHLQRGCQPAVLHRDIKPKNIMLDAELKVKLVDFGLARLLEGDRQSHTTRAAGTFGYMAPECMSTGKATTKSDVYSFGVVLLEIVTGRPALVNNSGTKQQGDETSYCLAEWLNMHRRDGANILGYVDSRVKGEFDESTKKQMKRVLAVGLWCAQVDPRKRPSIDEAVNMLRSDANMPSFPPLPLPSP